MTPSQPPPEPPKPATEQGQQEVTRAVYAMYGLVAGAVLMLAGLVVIMLAVLRLDSDRTVLGMGIGLVLLGGTAALPRTFMPILSAVLKKIPGRAETIRPPGAVELLEDDEDPKP